MRKTWKIVVALAIFITAMFTASLTVSAEGVADVFDAEYYADQNADLKEIFGYDAVALFNHYMTSGLNEGRCASPTFNVVEYRRAYPDLEAVFGDNWDAYVNHYYTCGMAEGRNAGVVETNHLETSDKTQPIVNTGTDETLSYAQQVIELVNAERAKEGLSALTMQTNLMSASDVRAKEQEQLFSHTRPDGRRCFSVLDDMGISYQSAGENIAWGQWNPSAVMDSWMNSSGHRANILDSRFKNIGVGCWKGEFGTWHWVQLFTS